MAKQILVVEDSQAIRGLIATLMETDADHVVTEARDGFAALRLLPHQQFDLIITDINMPDINGLELLHYVRQSERHRNVPVVIVTSESSEQDRLRGLALGASDYLTKPFAAETFLGVVHRLLGP